LVEDNGIAVGIEDLQDLQDAPAGEVIPEPRNETIDEGIGLLRVLGPVPARAARILDEPDIAVRVELHALIGSAPCEAGNVDYLGREVGCGGPYAAVSAFL
jgi:hypothetical protein